MKRGETRLKRGAQNRVGPFLASAGCGATLYALYAEFLAF
jgi:hypothetical protein